MSGSIASKAPPEASEKSESTVAITRRVVTSRRFAIRILIGVVGAVALGWLGPKAALAGLILSQLLGDVVEEIVTSRKWSLRRIWLVVALFLLFDFGRRAWAAIRTRPAERHARGPLTAPVVATLAATAVVAGAFTVADVARGHSLLNDRRTTFFGGRVAQPAPPTLKLADGRVVDVDTSAVRVAFGDVLVGRTSAPKSIVLSSGSKELDNLAVAAVPAAFRLESTCPRTLAARSTCRMTVVFRPERVGHSSGRLTVGFRRDPELALELTGVAIDAVAPSIAPSELRFPGTRVDATTAAKSVTLRAGSAALPIAGISIGSREYRISHDGCPRRLAATTSCTISVTFTPLATGSRGTVLTVARGDGGPALTSHVVGTGIAPTTEPTLTPGQVDFGSIRRGSTATPVVMTLAAGSAALPIASITTTSKAFTITAESCPRRLESSSTCTISVTFTPVTTGSRKATLTVTRGDGGPALTAALSGSGLPPPTQATLSPRQVDFGNVPLRSGSEPILFTLAAGADAVPLAGISIASKDFRITADNCPDRLEAATSCTVSVIFEPAAPGGRKALLEVNRNDGGTPLTAALSGSGLAVPATLTPTQADFGSVAVGSKSKPIAFTLAAGSDTLPIAGVTIRSKDYHVSDACPVRLAAWTSCTISVVFAPVGAGSRQSTLEVDRGDGAPPLTSSLTGAGLAAVVTLTPTSIDFGDLCTDCPSESSTVRVTLANTGTAPLTIKAILSSDAKQFSVTSKCPSTLSAGGTCAFSVTFRPSAPGTYKAVVRLDANGLGQHSLSIQGSGSVG